MAISALEKHADCAPDDIEHVYTVRMQTRKGHVPSLTGPMLPITVRTPFSLWNFSKSTLNLGVVSSFLGVFFRDFELRIDMLSGLAGSCGEGAEGFGRNM